MAVNQVDYGDKELKVRSLEVLEGLTGAAVSDILTKVEQAKVTATQVRTGVDSLIAGIASDNRLTVVDKNSLKAKWRDFEIEKPKILERAEAVGIGSSTEALAYAAAYDALYAFLWVNPGPLLNMASTTEIVGTQLISLWDAYVTTREDLLKARDAVVNTKVAQASRFFYGDQVPVGPYDIGDFWVVSETIYISTVARGAGESDVNDWEWYIRPNLMTVIESTNGDVFKPGQTTVTTLIAHVFQNGLEVTSSISETRFRWRRASFYPLPPPDDDSTWNSNHTSGYKTIEVTAQDIYARATYFCDIME